MSSGEITGEHFQSLEYLVQKCGTFSNLVAQHSVLNSQYTNVTTGVLQRQYVLELFHVMNVGVDS